MQVMFSRGEVIVMLSERVVT